MEDPFEFWKDAQLLARLTGASQFGGFTAYTKMQVTADGRRRGYFDLQCGDDVHTPQSKAKGKGRLQLPLRDGLLYRILLGHTKAGRKKTAETQKNLLCLSYVETTSRYASAPQISNPLGLYDGNHSLRPAAENQPRSSECYTWVFTSPRYTSPREYIWRMYRPSLLGLCPPDFQPETEYPETEYDFDGPPPSDGRTYTFVREGYGSRWLRMTYDGAPVDELPTVEMMEDAIGSFKIPAVNTALGQAKRSMIVAKATGTPALGQHTRRAVTDLTASLPRKPEQKELRKLANRRRENGSSRVQLVTCRP